jgi:uncharacterized protein YdeI (YjbR/CyaY-like superfamily)
LESSKTDTNAWNKDNSWSEELEFLKSIIAKTGLIQTTKWGSCVYVLDNKNVIGIGGFKNYFTIWFFNGVFLKDEKKILVNAQKGVTKSLRQWRFTSKDQVDEALVLDYIQEAIENERQGKIIKTEKVGITIEMPEIFQKELDLDKNLAEAFLKFSPYKQKEFLEYIVEAKREETKRSRIEKIKPMILENIGLNDKYR